MPDYTEAAAEYDEVYDPGREDEAHAQRGEFIRRFPARNLKDLKLSEYAIGLPGHITFCYWVEPGTQKWARIVGATAAKFGIYYGETRTDSKQRYRYTQKFSDGLRAVGSHQAAYNRVRTALVDLVKDGRNRDFQAIDDNPLSQMFKAKILSLYYPDQYLAICSRDKLYDLADELEFDRDIESPSQIQHESLVAKSDIPGVSNWTNYKYASFLFEFILTPESKRRTGNQGRRPPARGRNEREVDFEKLMEKWRELGKKSEEYALEFEKSRLRSIGHPELVTRIKDRTKRPGYGYDYESFTRPGRTRYIEVKTFTPVNKQVSRFYLSENENATARKHSANGRYFFYLVTYGSDGEPDDCQVCPAEDVLEGGDIEPRNYLVRLSRHSS